MDTNSNITVEKSSSGYILTWRVPPNPTMEDMAAFNAALEKVVGEKAEESL